MRLPSDREFAELQKDAEQRRLMRGGRGFLLFFRVGLFVFLAIGIVLFLATGWKAIHYGTDTFAASLYAIIFLLLWNLIVLSMIRLVSTKLAVIKREEQAEQSLGTLPRDPAGHSEVQG